MKRQLLSQKLLITLHSGSWIIWQKAIQKCNGSQSKLDVNVLAPNKGLQDIALKDSVLPDGIDISHYQGAIDWEKIPSVQFIYIKATEGASLVDRRYATNLKEAQREGLKVGSYHFFVSRTSADRQFENFRKRVNKSKQDLIPVVDVEKSGCKNATREQLQERLKQFMELVKKEYGTYPIIYSDHHFYNEFLSPEFDKYTLFLARYNNEPPRVKSNAEHIIWQFSERGMVEGIKERVDLDRFANGASMSDISL